MTGTDVRPGPVLVIGATGRVGGELVRLLNEADRPVRALLRSPGAAARLPAGVDAVPGDLRDRSSLATAVSGVDAVFLAVRDHPDQVDWETRLIGVLEQRPPVRLVKLSAFAAGLDPAPGYGRIHRAIEKRLEASKLDWLILRPYMYMQNLLDLASAVRGPGFLPLPLGAAEIAFIDARDVARAAFHALEVRDPQQRTWVLTGPEALSGAAAARIMSASLGRRIRYLALPQWGADIVMRLDGVAGWDVSMRRELFRMLRENGEARVTDDFSRLTGRQPRPLQDFVADHRQELGAKTVRARALSGRG